MCGSTCVPDRVGLAIKLLGRLRHQMLGLLEVRCIPFRLHLSLRLADIRNAIALETFRRTRRWSPRLTLTETFDVHVPDVHVCAFESLVPLFSFTLLSKNPPRSYPCVEIMNEYEQPSVAVMVPAWLHELCAQTSCSGAIDKDMFHSASFVIRRRFAYIVNTNMNYNSTTRPLCDRMVWPAVSYARDILSRRRISRYDPAWSVTTRRQRSPDSPLLSIHISETGNDAIVMTFGVLCDLHNVKLSSRRALSLRYPWRGSKESEFVAATACSRV